MQSGILDLAGIHSLLSTLTAQLNTHRHTIYNLLTATPEVTLPAVKWHVYRGWVWSFSFDPTYD